MGSVELKDLQKIFSDDIVAVDGVDIEIRDGEFVVLVGPSGSGKSTILRMISGLEIPTEGTIQIEDEDVTNKKPMNRDIAMVFQNYALYPHLDARGNISFGLKMRGGLSDEEISDRVNEAASIMDIEELLGKMPSELSGGQKQRVALGRAIVRDPEVFLMDEPLSNLDAKLRTQMRTEIQRLQSELGVTTIYVTHDQTEAMTMGDRIAILNEGELQQFTTPIESYYRPANMFVAGFIGSPSMNFVDVTAGQSDGNLVLSHPEFTIELSSERVQALPQSTEEFVLGVRPEDIELAETTDAATVTVTIDVIEPLGKEQLLYFDIGNQSCKASVAGTEAITEESEVQLLFPKNLLHLFDSDSGDAVLSPTIREAEASDDEISTRL
jgi:multiple sugar transport system ATP-binding protein